MRYIACDDLEPDSELIDITIHNLGAIAIFVHNEDFAIAQMDGINFIFIRGAIAVKMLQFYEGPVMIYGIDKVEIRDDGKVVSTLKPGINTITYDKKKYKVYVQHGTDRHDEEFLDYIYSANKDKIHIPTYIRYFNPFVRPKGVLYDMHEKYGPKVCQQVIAFLYAMHYVPHNFKDVVGILRYPYAFVRASVEPEEFLDAVKNNALEPKIFGLSPKRIYDLLALNVAIHIFGEDDIIDEIHDNVEQSIRTGDVVVPDWAQERESQ